MQLENLKKSELLALLTKEQIPHNPKLEKSELIKLFKTSSSFNKNDIKTTFLPPTQYLTTEYNSDITVLPQSSEKILIIWNADPLENSSIKAWKIESSTGLDILVPNYTRSIFIDISTLQTLDFSIFKIMNNDTKILFSKYSKPLSDLFPYITDSNTTNISSNFKTLVKQHLTEYQSSHQHFL